MRCGPPNKSTWCCFKQHCSLQLLVTRPLLFTSRAVRKSLNLYVLATVNVKSDWREKVAPTSPLSGGTREGSLWVHDDPERMARRNTAVHLLSLATHAVAAFLCLSFPLWLLLRPVLLSIWLYPPGLLPHNL